MKLILKEVTAADIFEFDIESIESLEKHVAERVIREFHLQNKNMHFVLTYLAGFITACITNQLDANIFAGISIMSIVYPEVFDNPIEFKLYKGMNIEFLSDVLQPFVLYENQEVTLN